MNIVQSDIKEVLLIQPKVFGDHRGYFFESYSKKVLQEHGVNYEFVQDNISKSKKGTVRGLHYQIGDKAQGKLCQVIQGSVLDVAVDIRFGSPTFGKYIMCELNETDHNLIWIPPGFAHGFCVTSDEAIFHYKCTEFYSPKDERAILYNDTDLNIPWNISEPLVSEKDLVAKKFKDIDKDFIYSN
ncbi:MAG: dTDP-4-dehydrorhamnose 3,5-epimerase [Ignavibacteria bacterium]|nr:dTDP-4-dehydrorhamnose 3,5-epimerase [Ignavibacteria bacterium]